MTAVILTFISWIYVLISIPLSIYGINLFLFTIIFWRRRWQLRRAAPVEAQALRQAQRADPWQPEWPIVTVQLPFYNEQIVAGRVIDAVANLDYPLDCLQIQALDDSTDISQQIVAERVEYWQKQGRWISFHHRSDRRDYKAGALRSGLATAQGEFIAIFDADFVPPADWLKRTVSPFLQPGSERIGMVQTRWAYLNDAYSLLTRAQALAFDGVFGVQQNACEIAGLFTNFNGSAGMLRRRCIEEAGNWRGDTLVEDLDLSYRIQLCGWRLHYLEDVSAPAELSPLMVGFKRQQFRWAKGSIQVLRLLGLQIWKSQASLFRRMQAIVFLSSYLAHPLMILLLLLTLPLHSFWRGYLSHLPMAWLGVFSMGVPLFYATSQWALHGQDGWWRWLLRMPLLFILGIGIAVNNSKAVLEALIGKASAFERTPKTGVTQEHSPIIPQVKEKLKIEALTWIELVLFLYAIGTVALLASQANWYGMYFIGMYVIGLGWVALESVFEAFTSARSGA